LTQNVTIGRKLVGDNCPSYIIAEVGINHNGSLDLALELIEKSAAAGADSVKFQNWITDEFISDEKKNFTYQSQGQEVTEPFYELCKRYQLQKSWLPALVAACDNAGVDFLSTPSSRAGVDELSEIGIRTMKNGSDFLSHAPLLRYMSENSDVVIVSTGMAWEDDVDRAVEAVKSADNEAALILLHCTSMYPTPTDQVNLTRMVGLRERYGSLVGYSDHTDGNEAAIQAVGMGACLFEKHCTLDHGMEGPDHWFSVTMAELASYVDAIRNAEARMGRKEIVPADGEIDIAKDQRLSIVAARELQQGQRLSEDDLDFKKPGDGINPSETKTYIGKLIKRDIPKNLMLQPEMFED